MRSTQRLCTRELMRGSNPRLNPIALLSRGGYLLILRLDPDTPDFPLDGAGVRSVCSLLNCVMDKHDYDPWTSVQGSFRFLGVSECDQN